MDDSSRHRERLYQGIRELRRMLLWAGWGAAAVMTSATAWFLVDLLAQLRGEG